MDYKKAINEIIDQESDTIGPVAERTAGNVEGLELEDGEASKIEGDEEEVLQNVLDAFSKIVGEKAVEASKRAVRDELDEVPDALKED